EYLAEFDQRGDSVPTVRPEEAWPLYQALAKATDQRLVRSCHDLSDGGLAVCLAESAFAGGLGAEIDLYQIPMGEPIIRDDFVLFSESPSRFLATISPKDQTDFEMLFEGLPVKAVGRVSQNKKLRIKGLTGKTVVEEEIGELKEAWQRPFKNY
ncbi:MAG: phosphoribosylformylglycinamidine synthase, partial [Candidatus Omnitrophica bacterium]|nr:phosphoribosylformylglycinamidine synthase [Candidatus Omnitrophota bacterium]